LWLKPYVMSKKPRVQGQDGRSHGWVNPPPQSTAPPMSHSGESHSRILGWRNSIRSEGNSTVYRE
jgi:hypothetical protein